MPLDPGTGHLKRNSPSRQRRRKRRAANSTLPASSETSAEEVDKLENKNSEDCKNLEKWKNQTNLILEADTVSPVKPNENPRETSNQSEASYFSPHYSYTNNSPLPLQEQPQPTQALTLELTRQIMVFSYANQQ